MYVVRDNKSAIEMLFKYYMLTLAGFGALQKGIFSVTGALRGRDIG